jgi:sugar fermentation stimulation protein A
VRFSSPLIPARFLRRRQRFLAEVELPGGRREWVHVPNSGALTGCAPPGGEILLTREDKPGRKTAHTWRFTRGPEGWICIDTLAPNRLVAEALSGPGQPGFPLLSSVWEREAGGGGQKSGSPDPPLKVRPEVTLPWGGRLDFVLDKGGRLAFLEVKSVTWVEEGAALFPDGVTTRGRRHLEHLTALVRQGHEAWQVFVVQREDAQIFRPAAQVDPAYARQLAASAQEGVRILVLQEKIAPPEITLATTLPFELTLPSGSLV